MFDVGWSEMAIIAVVILVVLGPKELPHALKTMSHWMRAARKLGSEFQSGVNEIVREAELDDAKRELQKISRGAISQKIEQAIDPAGELKQALKAPIESTAPSIKAPEAAAQELAAPDVVDPAAIVGTPVSNIEPSTSTTQSTNADTAAPDKAPAEIVIGDKSVSA